MHWLTILRKEQSIGIVKQSAVRLSSCYIACDRRVQCTITHRRGVIECISTSLTESIRCLVTRAQHSTRTFISLLFIRSISIVNLLMAFRVGYLKQLCIENVLLKWPQPLDSCVGPKYVKEFISRDNFLCKHTFRFVFCFRIFFSRCINWAVRANSWVWLSVVLDFRSDFWCHTDSRLSACECVGEYNLF